jgi:hypothetical protein
MNLPDLPDLLESFSKEFPPGMLFPLPRLSRQDRFASAVLNGPSEPAGEVCGIKFRTSPLLIGTGLSVMGYPGDADPHNYALLVHEESPEAEKVIARVLGEIRDRVEEKCMEGATCAPVKRVPPLTLKSLAKLSEGISAPLVGIAVNPLVADSVRAVVRSVFKDHPDDLAAPRVAVKEGQKEMVRMFYDRREFLEYLKPKLADFKL